MERLVDRDSRREIAAPIVEGYRTIPQRGAEVGWTDESSIRMIAEEPW